MSALQFVQYDGECINDRWINTDRSTDLAYHIVRSLYHARCFSYKVFAIYKPDSRLATQLLDVFDIIFGIMIFLNNCNCL